MSAPAPRRRRLRALARRRRTAALMVLLALPLSVLLLDLERRAPRVEGFRGEALLSYSTAIAESILVWGVLLYAAGRRRGVGRALAAFLFVTFSTFAVGGQLYFYEQYNAYLNVDVSVFATSFTESVVNQLFADGPNYLAAKLPVFAFVLGLVWAARRTLRPTRRRARIAGVLAPALLFASFFVPTQHRHLQASLPDVLYLHAVGGLLRTQLGFTEQSNQLRPRLRESLPVPPLTRRATLPPRNVLFVILESVRADATCVEFEPGCRRTEHTNLAFPERFSFRQMRAVDSSTAISLAVLWSGLYPNESRDRLHTWPLLFDYARAAGYDTAYWTSQNMLFGNVRLWVKNLGVRKFVSATELDPVADLDLGAPEGLLADHVIRELDTLREPYFAVVQLSNVHYPYLVDEAGPEPFQPATTSKAPENNPYFFNYYQNAVHQQDRHLARLLRYLRASEAGRRTVIVTTSDHGEAFREHGQMGHTFSVFDEEIHVPMWVDAPHGTLTEDEIANLRAKREALLFHVDLAPTLLDLMGVLDAPEIARYRERLYGHSLLRRELSEQPIPLTNCSGVWSCAFENWGAMQGSRKLSARSWDSAWRCFDVVADPAERRDLGPAACGELREFAERTFGRLPGQAWRGAAR